MTTELRLKTFINVKEPNTTYLIRESTSEENKPFVSLEGVIHKTTRVGDVEAEFRDGLLMTDDPEIISWCQARYPDILDMDDPAAEAMVVLQRFQTPRNNYEPDINSGDLVNTMSSSIDAAANARAESIIRERLAEELRKRGIEPTDEVDTDKEGK